MGLFFLLLVAMIVGLLADALVPGKLPGGWVGAMVAGIVGASIGDYLTCHFGGAAGPRIGGLGLLPALIGASLVVCAWGYLISQRRTTP